jgi:short subunit dehydrogenase-like uncharacterized protein
MDRKDWILYGANGYTGVLIAEEARRRGLEPVLAGRREEAIAPLASRLGLRHRVFPLDDYRSIAGEIRGAGAVLLAAGPFSATSRPVVDACLDAGVHYVDITGEIPVFEACARRDREARERGVALLPGAGFDVVPSDCLAASLHRALPAASRLELAIGTLGQSSISRGTARTMLEGIASGGAVREGRRIRRVPLAWKTAEIPFRAGPRTAVTIPWGDVSTAYHSTGIPDIAVYAAAPPRLIRRLRLLRFLVPLLALRPMQALVRRGIDRRVRGPDAEARERGAAELWGRAAARSGQTVEGTLVTPEGYRLTARTAVECVRRILEGGAPAGFLTPSKAFGPGFIAEFEGCDLRVGAATLG